MDKGKDQPQQLNLTVRAGLVEDALQLRARGVGTDVEFLAVLVEGQPVSPSHAEAEFRIGQMELPGEDLPLHGGLTVGVAQDDHDARGCGVSRDAGGGR